MNAVHWRRGDVLACGAQHLDLPEDSGATCCRSDIRYVTCPDCLDVGRLPEPATTAVQP